MLMRRLRWIIYELHAALNSSSLDHRSHGPRATKDRVTVANRLRFNDAANYCKDMLRLTREAVARDPADANGRALEEHGRRLAAVIKQFDNDFEDPPPDRPRLH